MTTKTRHRQWNDRLDAAPELGMPAGGITLMASTIGRGVEAGYVWVGTSRPPVRSTVPLCGGQLNVNLGPNGEFIGVEMLREITAAEVRRFSRWAHRRWGGTKGGHHVPCTALGTLLRRWVHTARALEPICVTQDAGVDQWQVGPACRP